MALDVAELEMRGDGGQRVVFPCAGREAAARDAVFGEGGVAVEYGPTEKVLNSPQAPRTKDFLKQAE